MSDQQQPTQSGPPIDMPGVAIEQLDTLVRVTTVHAWISLSVLFAVCAGAVVFASLYRVPKKIVGEGILLIHHDRLTQVRASGSGRLDRLNVKLGDHVTAGCEIGWISQEDLKDSIHETEARLDELRKEDVLLTEFEASEKTTQDQAIARVTDAINRAVANSTEGLKIADRIVHGSERLRLISQLSNLDYLKDLQQKYAIQNDLNTSQSRLAELELNRLTSENQRQRLKLQRRLEISKLETKLEIDRDKHNRTSRVVSRFEGTVAQILTANDEYVKEGSPIVLLSSPKDDAPGIDDFGQPFDSIVFVPAGEGKRIDRGNFVEIMPATVKREEHGYIHGKVISVSELPVTRLGMEAALQHRDLVDTFLKRYAPGVLLRVHIKLSEDPVRKKEHDRKVEAMAKQQAANPTGRIEMPDDEVNDYVWSSSSGSRQPLKTGTMCEAAIVVERPPLITLVVPWLRRSMGLD